MWCSIRLSQSLVVNIIVLGLGLVSAVAGYQNDSPIVTACGATASVGSFISFLICQLPRSRTRTDELNDRLRELEAQLAHAREEMVTMSETIRNEPPTSTRRRSVPHTPNSPNSLFSDSDSDNAVTPPPQYRTPSSYPAHQYSTAELEKLRIHSRVTHSSSNSSFSSPLSPSFTSLTSHSSYSSSASSQRPLPPPPYLSRQRTTESAPLDAELEKLKLSHVFQSAPSSPQPLSLSEAGTRSLPPPSYSRHEFPPHTHRPQLKLDTISEYDSGSGTTTNEDIEISPLRYTPPEYNFEDHPPLTTRPSPPKHSGIKRHGKTIIRGIRDKISGSGGKNSKSGIIDRERVIILPIIDPETHQRREVVFRA